MPASIPPGQPSFSAGGGRPAWLPNLLVLAGLGALLFVLMDVGAQWRASFQPHTAIDLSWAKLPQYALYSLARSWVAMFLSFVFAITYATWAYYDRRAASFLLPMLDILQSIPVLGFMPGVVLALIAVFPTSNLGLELACVVMIFTAQVWNMVFSYHDSLRAIPSELRQMGELAGFSPLQRFLRLELPFAAQGLIYNGMVSMAGGWFFLTITEAFTLENRSFQLPGLGSYMSEAIAQSNVPAQIAAVVAMGVVIVGMDRLFWLPLAIWSRKFKLEDSSSGPVETTLVARVLARSGFLGFVSRMLHALGHKFTGLMPRRSAAAPLSSKVGTTPRWVGFAYGTTIAVIGIGATWGCYRLLVLLAGVNIADWGEIIGKTLLTFLRVLATLVVSTLWTIPVGVWIGLSPRWARSLQPFIQFAASFPAPMLYPVVFGLVLTLGGTLSWGAVLLMVLGSQWYILFNVAAGAQSIPADLLACAQVFQLRRWRRWRSFILPAIFPFLVTGWITCAGGAWNASIVAEYLLRDGQTFVSPGIGSYISEATSAGQFPQLAAAIVVLAVFVAAINRSFWRFLQHKADLYCRFES